MDSKGYFEILLASDFTARSDLPLGRGLRIARQTGGKLVIVHVCEKGAADPANIAALRAGLPEEARDVELVVQSGSLPETLARIAKERGSDLIITGVARHNSLGDYVLGTAVDHIVRHAVAPVLVVRRPTADAWTHMVVATDLSDCSRAALLAAAEIFTDPAITLVHAFHVPYGGWLKSPSVQADMRAEAQAGLDAFLAHPDVAPLASRISARIGEGDPGSVVRRQLEETRAGLLVLGTHGRSGFAHATVGSHAEAMLAAVDVDVLMVRERRA